MEEGGREGGREGEEEGTEVEGFFEGISEFMVYFCFFAMGHSFTSLKESRHISSDL